MSDTKVKPIRLGIIGSGLAVEWLHWPALEKMRGHFQVVMTCDVIPEAAQKFAEKARDLNPDGKAARITTDYQAVLAANDVDAVLISLPIHLTAQVLRDAAQSGKHIICEKPVGANLPQAQHLVAELATLKTGVIVIAENWHYHPTLKRARTLMDEGRIGQIYLIQVIANFSSDPSKGFAGTPWRWDTQYRGGIVTDAGIHQAAMLRELGGAVEQLQGFTKSVHPVMRGIDSMVLNLRFRSGALGNLTITGAASAPPDDYARAVVFGTSGTLMIGETTIDVRTPDESQPKGYIEETIDTSDEPSTYELEFRNFYNAIVHGEAVVSTPEEALRDLEIIMRALDSAEERSVILLS